MLLIVSKWDFKGATGFQGGGANSPYATHWLELRI